MNKHVQFLRNCGGPLWLVKKCEAAADEIERLEAERDEVREPVRWFAEQMECKLAAHDDRSGWNGEADLWLLHRLHEELNELEGVIGPPENRQLVIDECADVANFAMMIADNARVALAREDG